MICAFDARLRASSACQRADGDQVLIDDLLRLMATTTPTSRSLSAAWPAPTAQHATVWVDREAFDAWALRYHARLALENSDDTERAAGA
jgi:uncharacterized protein YdiU (UPF0061 family)